VTMYCLHHHLHSDRSRSMTSCRPLGPQTRCLRGSVRTGQDASRQPHVLGLSNINPSANAHQRIAPALMPEPPASPSPSSGRESVEVTGVLAVTSFSTTLTPSGHCPKSPMIYAVVCPITHNSFLN
jgi:hypothetical protein